MTLSYLQISNHFSLTLMETWTMISWCGRTNWAVNQVSTSKKLKIVKVKVSKGWISTSILLSQIKKTRTVNNLMRKIRYHHLIRTLMSTLMVIACQIYSCRNRKRPSRPRQLMDKREHCTNTIIIMRSTYRKFIIRKPNSAWRRLDTSLRQSKDCIQMKISHLLNSTIMTWMVWSIWHSSMMARFTHSIICTKLWLSLTLHSLQLIYVSLKTR